jgi:hypothetical protein
VNAIFCLATRSGGKDRVESGSDEAGKRRPKGRMRKKGHLGFSFSYEWVPETKAADEDVSTDERDE